MTFAIFLCAAVFVTGCGTSSNTTTGPEVVKCQVSTTTPPMMDSTGGASTFSVTAQPECAWSATTSASWISGVSPTSGQGSRDVEFRVAPNEGAAARDGEIVVNDSRIRVSQRASCRYDLAPASQKIGVDGGSASITITTAAECAWTAATDANWIALSPPLNGTGTATVNFTVAPSSNERTGSIVIAGQRATVTQAGIAACTYAISPTNQSIAAAGGPGAPVTVTTESGCRWNAISNASWITVAGGASGTGNGSVTFNVAANIGAARTGTLTIGGNTLTVSQAAVGAPPCTFSIAPMNQNAPAAASTGTVTVTAAAGCTWTAASNATWLTIASGGSGSGNGTVEFNVAANTGAQRTGTLTVAGQTFTVTQAAVAVACSYSISPAAFNFDAGSAAGFVNITTAAGCNWTATSSVAWVVIRSSSASGSGSAVVGFDVASNPGAQRSVTLTIAGQAATVTQAAFVPPCTYSLSPANASAPNTPSTGTINVVTSAQDCVWNAGNNQPWLTIASAKQGTGNATITYNVAENPGPQRVGTLIVSGQTFTLTQAGACTYAISPTSASLPNTASSGTLNVDTADGCAWTAATGAAWITITGGATGSGKGVVAFSVTANTGPLRTGTIVVAGQNVTVTQMGTALAP